jgi:hypothetical protein
MDGKHYDREVAGVEGVGGHEGGSGLGEGGPQNIHAQTLSSLITLNPDISQQIWAAQAQLGSSGHKAFRAGVASVRLAEQSRWGNIAYLRTYLSI